MLPIWEPLHGQRQIPPIARTPLAPTGFPFLPRCTPVWVRLPPPPLLLLLPPPPPPHREGIYILIGRAAKWGYVFRQAAGNAPSCTSFQWTLQTIPGPVKMIFWASLSAAYGNIYINIYTHAYFTKQTRSLKWDFICCQRTSGVIR